MALPWEGAYSSRDAAKAEQPGGLRCLSASAVRTAFVIVHFHTAQCMHALC